MDLQSKLAIAELGVLLISAALVVGSIIVSYRWNRKKVSQETLDGFIVGNLPDLNAKVRIDYNCDVYDTKSNYTNFIKKLNEVDSKKFEDCLIRILNIYEVISINIENRIINEKICFEYISLQLTAYYSWCEPLISKLKRIANDDRVYEHLALLAKKWHKQINKKSSA